MKRAFTPSASEATDEAGDLEPTQTLAASDRPALAAVSGADAASLVDGQAFGDYRIVRRLGKGGMGTVYETDHVPTGRRVALKVLSRSWDNPQARARFLREGRLAASINHPNSVYVYGTEQIGETPSISMELIHGGTLQQWVKTRGRMNVSSAVDSVLQIIDGLEAADRKGVLHRDVKPANCFVDNSGTIKIGDFGLSISTDGREDMSITSVTSDGAFLGTPAFASPEQLRGEALDRRSDIYSVGVTLYYLLTGTTPFTAENMVQLLATVLDKPAPSLRAIQPDVPEALDAVVQRCLQKSAGQRYASYDALREALIPFSSKTPTAASMGTRLIANIVDVVLLTVVLMFVTYTWQWIAYGRFLLLPRFGKEHAWFNVGVTLLTILIPFLYYAILEWRFGRTLGKHLLNLRVVSKRRQLALRQACIRAGIFVFVPNTPSLVYSVMVREMTVEMMHQTAANLAGMLVGLSFYALKLGIFATARTSNGYAGVHELCSGTRVVNKPSLRVGVVSSEDPETFDAVGSEDRIGAYHVLKPIRENAGGRIVLAYDTKLLRRVWIQQQPVGSPDVDSASRNLGRRTRLRWLGARRTEAECWDCYEAPSGQPFCEAVSAGASWDVMISALKQLCRELRLVVEEGSVTGQASLAHLWLTEEESLKLLPFAMGDTALIESGGGFGLESGDAKDGRRQSDFSELRLFQEAVRYLADSTNIESGSGANRGISMRAYESLSRLGHVRSLDDAAETLERLSQQPAINIRQRTAGMLSVSLAVPTLLFLSAGVAGLAIEQQKVSMPDIEKLAKIATVAEIQSYAQDPESEQNIDALKTLIAARYRDVAEDRTQMESFYAMVVIPPNRRGIIREALAGPERSEPQVDAAELRYKAMLEKPAATVAADMSFFSLSGLFFLSAISWMEVIWVPSLVTAILFGGGAVLRIFGLTLVNRRGERASRFRVALRMLIGGIPAVVFAIVMMGNHSLFGSGTLVATIGGVAMVLLVVMAFVGCRSRLPHDRIAGTYLVAR